MKSYLRGVLVLIIICIKLYESEGFCGNRTLDLELVQLAVQSGEWLKQQRNETGGFGEGHESGQVFLALKLLGFSLDDSATAHIRSELDRHGFNSISASRLAHYIHGVLSVCGNPKHFHNHLYNLVHRMKKGLAKQSSRDPRKSLFGYSVAVLALCNSGHAVKQSFVKVLIKEMKDLQAEGYDAKTPFTPDTVAMGTVALACVYEKQMKQKRADRKNLRLEIKNAIHHLLHQHQKKDGSFGNEITTALVVQAILAANRKHLAQKLIIKKWSCENSMRFIIDKKDHWFRKNVMSTTHILPSLIGAVLFDIDKVQCSAPEPAVQNIEVHVKLVIESDNQKKGKTPPPPELMVSVPKNNGSAYTILEEAAKRHPCYKFKTKKSSYGNLITEICGVPNNAEKKYYWMIYSTDETLAPHGIDEFYPENGSWVIFKYKKLM